MSILIAGIGNIFLGDDAFGVEVVQRLLRRTLPDGVTVRDFGIRGFDLTYALLEPWDAAILVDATTRGGPPGTLYVIEPEATSSDAQAVIVETHAMDPVKVLELARKMGSAIPKLRVVGCEPASFGSDEEPALGLSPSVAQALEPAVALVEELVHALRAEAVHA